MIAMVIIPTIATPAATVVIPAPATLLPPPPPPVIPAWRLRLVATQVDVDVELFERIAHVFDGTPDWVSSSP